MYEKETNPNSAGSNPPALKHVKVFDEQHSIVKTTVQELSKRFCEKAKALGIPIKKRGKFHNIPGQAEAVECIFTALEPGMEGMSLENLAFWYVEDMFNVEDPFKKAKGAQ